ncbi:MAG: beta-phosphoglucomutase family hydrolase [Rhodospirillales bacterium]|nr:MAG: beta-phosphoglucomutase family hydrolase [Rhodospirillales bacterium]
MTTTLDTIEIDADAYDAWLFDLDGIITDTASVHATAWKKMFDAFLKTYAEREDAPFEPFEVDPDYFRYVDGRPRYEGVDSFLRSRGIVLERGDPSDAPDKETVCGLGNRKNAMFNDVLKEQGAEVFQTSVELIRKLKAKKKRIAVVTSSKNCDTVLEVAGLTGLFEAKVDGNVAAEKNLAGKPDPHTYEVAAKMLGATPDRSVVFEDAISGVQAGRAGGFGLVIGVARHDDPEALRKNGADIVVADLGELRLR